MSDQCKRETNVRARAPSQRMISIPTLVVGEYPEDVDLRVGGEPEALGATGDDARHEGAVAKPVVKRLLVRPIGALAHPLEVRMRLGETWI